MNDVVIIGGGAAGIFAAGLIASNRPGDVLVLEKSNKLLSKVRVSGGGRCNVTHACFDPSELIHFYPRGARELLGPFHRFGPSDMISWLDQQSVELKVEEDGRMFPTTDRSETIIDAMLNAAKENRVIIRQGIAADSFHYDGNAWSIICGNETIRTRFLIIASGGFPKSEQFDFIRSTGHRIIKPVPSLFTFNLVDKSITELMGVSVPDAVITLEGSSLETNGPLLITHWGFSGPAVLRMSALAARILAEKEYRYQVRIQWSAAADSDFISDWISSMRQDHPSQQPSRNPPFPMPTRLWEYLCNRAGILPLSRWADLRKEQIQQLTSVLCADIYFCQGKTTYKEEFVTSGGIDLKEVDLRTMESKLQPGLFFAGEVLDIDAVTGGFNFQAAWTTAWIAAQTINERL